MQQQIWKYPLRVTDIQTVKMPQSSRILCVQEQHGQPCLWALVFPHMENVSRFIEIIGTGHPIEQDGKNARTYIGTFQLHNGELVFHVFERYTELGPAIL